MFPPELNSEFETEPGAGHPDATRPVPAEYSNFNRQTQAGPASSDPAEARRQQEHFYHAALNEVTLGLMKRQEPGPLLKTIVEKAARLVGTRLAYVSLVDPTNSFLELKVKLDDEVNRPEYFQTMKKGEGLAGLVWEQNRTIVLDNYSVWAERLQRPIYENLHATINLPLRAGDQVLGVLGLGHLTEDKKFTEAEIELLTRFAELASIALDNAQLYSRAQQEIAERKAVEEDLRKSRQHQRELLKSAQRLAQEEDLINQVRNAVAREVHLPAIIRKIVEAIKETFHYELVSLYLLAPETNYTELVMQHQIGYATIINRQSTEKGIIGLVARIGQAILLEDVRTNPLFMASVPGIVSEVCVPLVVQGRTVGVFNVETNNGIRLTKADLNLMKVLAEHINIAIERGWLYSEVQKREKQYRSVFNSLKEVVFQTDEQGRWTFLNPAWTEISGYTLKESLGTCFLDYIHPDDRQYNAELFTPLLERTQEYARHEVRWMIKDGSWRWIRFFARLTLDEENGVAGISGTLDDITESKLAEEALESEKLRFLQLAENIKDVFWIVDPKLEQVLYISPAYEEIWGRSRQSVYNYFYSFLEAVHPADYETVVEHQARKMTGEYELEYRVIRPDGSIRWVWDKAFPVRNKAGEIYRVAAISKDITERKLAEEKLRHYALHDALTGLANRTLFMDRLEHAMTRNRRHNNMFAVLFMDLDRFKVINDSLGHVTGDQLLIAIARRLTGCLRPEDTVARFGGDEFTILLEDIDGPQDATLIADRIQEEIARPFDLYGQEVFTSTSIGIAMSELGVTDAQDLLRNADTALYKAKASGKARYALFDLGMHASAVKLLQLETDMRKALEKDEFCVYYQPIISLCNGEVKGFEALIRWQHPEKGLVSPGEFIPVAEETGLIVPIGWKMLYESCRQMREWQTENPDFTTARISVNLSSRQFLQPDLVEQIKAALSETGLSPRNLTLEITESVLMENAEIITTSLLQLRAMGIQLALDDFGTGYSSLSYLHRFPIDTLKIDRSFVSRITSNGENTELVRTIITMAHNLGIEVTAEGVETTEQLNHLRTLLCEAAQGYLIAQPAPAEIAGEWLQKKLLIYDFCP
jgi:diguanylate cyclase (GGDEF)-like protein/PAS domain S-box-containing protein